jgi:hypothetical protein
MRRHPVSLAFARFMDILKRLRKLSQEHAVNEPQLQTKPQSEAVDDERMTAIAVVNPSIVLLESSGCLTAMISRDTVLQTHATQLRGVRLVRLPLGWRLALLQCAARVYRARLPEEFDIPSVTVDARDDGVLVTPDGRTHALHADLPMLALSGSEYLALIAATGRSLHQWIDTRFRASAEISVVCPNRRRQSAA